MRVLTGLGAALALLRGRSGYPTQEALGKKMGLAQSSIGRAEAADANPRASTLDRWLDTLGVDAHDLADALDEVNGRIDRRLGNDLKMSDGPEAMVLKLQARLLRLEEEIEQHGLKIGLVPVSDGDRGEPDGKREEGDKT